MATLVTCSLSLNDYNYIWFASKAFVVEQENTLLHSYQNLSYVSFALTVVVAVMGANLVKRDKANPITVLAVVCVLSLFTGLAANYQNAKEDAIRD